MPISLRTLPWPPAKIGEVISRSGIERLGGTRCGRSLSREESMDALPSVVEGSNRRTGRSYSVRSCCDELADSELAFNDGIVLPSHAPTVQNSHRKGSFSFGPICSEVANPFSRIRSAIRIV